MADNAIFSSFRRPPSPAFVSMQEVPPEAATIAEVVESAPALPPEADPVPAQDSPNAQHWAELSAVAVGSDQLGLANPACITLMAKLPGAPPVLLEADAAGLYRPPGFRPAPWSGFAYDEATSHSTGIAAGARIQTARGEVEVEKLVPGDAAMSMRDGALLPISWIGCSAAVIGPIRIDPGALGSNIPRRTLHVGPEQTVHIDSVPVPARTLVNGTTIREDKIVKADLFHIDVGREEVLIAEGLALSSSHGARALE